MKEQFISNGLMTAADALGDAVCRWLTAWRCGAKWERAAH